MYQSQVRPDKGGRKLVAQSQPKQHSSSPRTHRDATLTFHSFLQSYLFQPGLFRGAMLALGTVSLMASLSACGGVTYRNLGTTSAGTESTTLSLSRISCGTQSLTGSQSKDCSVYLSRTASGPTTVKLSSSNAALEVPAAVTVQSGATSTGFKAVSSAVTRAVSVTIKGNEGGVTKTDVITLYPEVAGTASLTKLSCGTQTLTGPTKKACSVYLSEAAHSPVTVSLSSSNRALQVPSSVTVPAGSATAGFTATASTVKASEKVTLTGSWKGVSESDVIQLDASETQPQPTTQHEVKLDWNAPSSTPVPIVGYKVYRATGGSSNYALLNSTLDATTSYTDSTVGSGLTYDYVVRSVDSSGVESAPSNETLVTIP